MDLRTSATKGASHAEVTSASERFEGTSDPNLCLLATTLCIVFTNNISTLLIYCNLVMCDISFTTCNISISSIHGRDTGKNSQSILKPINQRRTGSARYALAVASVSSQTSTTKCPRFENLLLESLIYAILFCSSCAVLFFPRPFRP